MRADHVITVEITGIHRPPVASDLTAANLASLWDAIRFLPMPRDQHHFLERYLLGPCAERSLSAYLTTHPTFSIPLGAHELRIRWVNDCR
ncbi:hypothetical protein ACFV4F_30135 [Kitasatospora sp. NPDC059722]|uniref:hypothetical protein n=1 Tax=Kitasatospora sp. NPDC059722 TaxID=3346925 RepID=UPI003696C351